MFKNNFLTKLIFFISSTWLTLALPESAAQQYNVNIVGFINDNISLSRHALAFINCLQKKVPLTLIKSRKTNTKDMPEYLKDLNNHSIDLSNHNSLRLALKNDFTLTGITILTDSLSIAWKEYLLLPNKSSIKIMFAVTERTEIPPFLVKKLNTHFDAIAVPDEWMIDIFKQSGVNLPIFVLPLVLDQNLESLLKLPLPEIKFKPNKPFVFGMTGGFTPRKNHVLILKAFAQEFGNNPDFKLILHGAYGQDSSHAELLEVKNHYNLDNVEIVRKKYSRKEYEDFIRSLDCYSFVSKGEGFSITPREAMAAGVPCILSDNTAHKVICKTGLVYSVPSTIIEPAYYVPMERFIGTDFNCDINDVREAMREIYNNYEDYQARTTHARKWVKQYLSKNLAPYYLNLVKPKLVILGPDNRITDSYLMTNSATLYKKYQELCKNSGTEFKNYE